MTFQAVDHMRMLVCVSCTLQLWLVVALVSMQQKCTLLRIAPIDTQ
jgi:hypothetical protein